MPRIKTYFGIPIPPWKPKKIKAASPTLTFVLKGKIPSKKNNNQSVCVTQAAQQYITDHANGGSISVANAREAVRKVTSKIIPNIPYNNFISANMGFIEEQREVWRKRMQDKGRELIYPIRRASVKIRFYWAHKHRQDTMNKTQTILDLLVQAMILADDDYTVCDPIAEGQLYKDEIVDNICEIKITVDI
jgi:hypothetical protein